MSDDEITQQGQDPDARQQPQELVRESIKYRRRAQDAERRAEALESEVQSLRDGRQADLRDLEQRLEGARAEADSLRGRLSAIERDRRIEQEFRRAGCTDLETAVALAEKRMAGGEGEDLAALAAEILSEKPHLRSPAPSSPGLPPQAGGARPAAAGAARRTVDRLAEQARRTGQPADVMAYMRARRTAAV